MSLPHFSLSAAWTAAGWTMVHLIWTGLLIGIVAAVLRRSLRTARAETRHAVSMGGLMVLCLAAVILFAVMYEPERGTSEVARLAAQLDAKATVDFAKASPRPLLPVTFDVQMKTADRTTSACSWLSPIVAYLPGIWLSGSLVTLGLVATGLVGVERLRRAGRPIASGAIIERCQALATSIGLTRRFQVAICDRVSAPIVIGILRPMILLPPAVITGWPIEQLEMALLHELAHIRRHDNLVSLAQRLAEALLFFHPVTWWLSAWISLERELCCDRLVVEQGKDPVAYAGMLASLAGARIRRQGLPLGIAERPIVRRIRAILNKEDRAMRMTFMEGVGVALSGFLVAAVTLASYAGPPQQAGAKTDGAALERLARTVAAVPDFAEADDDGKGRVLLSISENQLRRGDRAGALTTLGLVDALAYPSNAKPGPKADLQAWMRAASLGESAIARHKAGDPKGAKSALERAARLIEILDNGTFRQTYEALDQAVDAAIATKKTEFALDDQTETVHGAYMILIEASLELGENALARTLLNRMSGYVGANTSATNCAMLGVLGAYLVKAGDPEAGRALIERSRQTALGLTSPEAIDIAVPMVAQSLFEAGQTDEALAFVRTLAPKLKKSAIARILASLTSGNPSEPDLYDYGIKLTYPLWAPKDAASARVLLPRIIAAAQGGSR